MRTIFILLNLMIFLFACKEYDYKKESGVSLDPSTSGNRVAEDAHLPLQTRPSSVVLTGHPDHRLITVYKVNYNSKKGTNFIGQNRYHRSSEYKNEGYEDSWHHHFMPGLEALYGYNLLNVSHYNLETGIKQPFFEDPVLINTLYYPAFDTDSLQNQPISRDYYLVSVYDEDTNRDSLINGKDLRRIYSFNLNGQGKSSLVPLNYSVSSSEYDAANDVMYIFARKDENGNGKREEQEPVHVFWIDLKAPSEGIRLY